MLNLTEKILDWQFLFLFLSILVIGFLIIKKLFFNKKGDLNKKVKKLMLEGLKYDKIGEYQTALYFFKQILSLTDDFLILRDVYFAIAGCLLNLKRYENCIDYCNKFLLDNNNLNDVVFIACLKMRFYCLEKIGDQKASLKDLILYNSLKPNNLNEEKIYDLIYKISIEEASLYCKKNLLSYSNIRYDLFFDTLVGFLSKEDGEIINLIKNKEYQKLDEMLFKETNKENTSILKKIQTSKSQKSIFLMTLVKSSLLYLKGDLEKVKNLLKDCKNDFEFIFYEYLNSTIQNSFNLDLKYKRILSSNNPTVIYYLAKIYFNQKDYDNYLYQMGKLLDFNFAYCDFLLFFDQNNDNIKFEDFAREGLMKFPGDSRISYICAIHYFERNQFESMTKIIEGMSDKDPVKYYLLGLISNEKNDFKKAIELDPTYHEAYMKLDDDYDLTLKSLVVASCYEEVFESIRNLIMIENNEYLKSMRNGVKIYE